SGEPPGLLRAGLLVLEPAPALLSCYIQPKRRESLYGQRDRLLSSVFFLFIIIIFNCFSFFFFFSQWETCKVELTTLFFPSCLPLAVVSVDGKPVRLQLCDTAGQDEFDKLRPLCYTNTDIFLLCFSVVSPSSFQNVSEKWVPEIRCHCPKAPIILVGTQSDLREDVKVLIELDKCKEKPVPEEAAKLCAEEIKAASYIECSALTQKNLKEVFDAAIVAGIQYSDTQQQPKKSKCRTPDKMKNLSKSWWKKYCCFV
uniref:Ras homolog family member U n=1 Tax=Gallus gallus TaxID=9031 RepID=A0A8V0XM93_CHICK